jgi:hypothetical protein
MTDIQSFDSLYPGRFLKAGMFNGQPVTYTIKSIQHDEIEGEKGTEQKVVLTFQETPFEHVLPKINAVAIKAMFGPQVQEWVGKRVTLYGTTAIMPFPKKKDEPCIRIFGSPDIKADVRCEWTPPRRKVVVQILRPVQSPVLIAALAAIDADPDAGALEKFTTRADILLQEGKINDAEHAEITAAIQKRRPEPSTPEPDVSVSAADSAAVTDPVADGDLSAAAAVDPVALKLRERQQLIRTVNALTPERKDALISALKEQFEFSSDSPISGQLSTQAHADFITSFISSQ